MFKTRLLSGVILVILALGAFILGGPALAAISLVISCIAFLELVRAMGIREQCGFWNGLSVTGLVGVLAYYGVVYFSGDAAMEYMVLLGVLLAFMFVYVFRFPKYRADQVFGAFFSFVYAPVMISFLYQTRQLPHGEYIVWLILISSWGCDTFAYVVGMLLGKKKIFPVLSPKKSLEGCIGGVAGAMLLGWLFSHLAFPPVVGDGAVELSVVLICGLGAVMSQVGDLAASAVKRNYQIKDYGRLIPGHGGIMDRFDSVIVTAPLIYFMALLFIA